MAQFLELYVVICFHFSIFEPLETTIADIKNNVKRL